jgi:two-component system, NarL family, response regulator NreC
MYGAATDIHEERMAREELAGRVRAATIELRTLSQRLLVVQEEERRHIVRELHDEIGQALTGLKFRLASANRSGTVSGDASDTSRGGGEPSGLAEAEEIVQELTTRVSELSMDLRPIALDNLGVLPALLSYVERFQARTSLLVDLRHPGLDRRFAPPVEITAYRVVQEALTNVARHAEATAVTVQLLADDESLTVAIRDDRVGFDPQIRPSPGGLSGMRERVALPGRDHGRRGGAGWRYPHHGRASPGRWTWGVRAQGRHMITVVLVDDHPIVRQGVRSLLEGEVDCQVVGEAADGLTALDLIAQARPDVVIVDVQLPDLNGLEVARRVRQRALDTRVVMLSMFADEAYVLEALRHGVAAYVLKASATSDLVAAVHAAVAGQRYLSAPLTERAIEAYAERAEAAVRPLDRYELLSAREREVLQLAAQGLGNAEIGERLVISPRTAETQRANLLRKLGLHNQTDLVRFAVGRGLIQAVD